MRVAVQATRDVYPGERPQDLMGADIRQRRHRRLEVTVSPTARMT